MTKPHEIIVYNEHTYYFPMVKWNKIPSLRGTQKCFCFGKDSGANCCEWALDTNSNYFSPDRNWE